MSLRRSLKGRSDGNRTPKKQRSMIKIPDMTESPNKNYDLQKKKKQRRLSFSLNLNQLTRKKKKLEPCLFSKEITETCPILLSEFFFSAIEKIENNIVEGLFRLCGSKITEDYCIEVLDEGKTIDFSTVGKHCVASLLKSYFREMKTPLIKGNIFIGLRKMLEIPEEEKKIEKCIELLKTKMETERLFILKYLLKLLHEISVKKDITKMSSQNLSTMFAPNLMKCDVPKSDLGQFLVFNTQSSLMIMFLIDNFHKIFDKLYSEVKDEEKRLFLVKVMGTKHVHAIDDPDVRIILDQALKSTICLPNYTESKENKEEQKEKKEEKEISQENKKDEKFKELNDMKTEIEINKAVEKDRMDELDVLISKEKKKQKDLLKRIKEIPSIDPKVLEELEMY